MIQKVPRIISQSDLYLMLEVPSKSQENTKRLVEYLPNGDKKCSCPGSYWYEVRGLAYDKECRHHRMTTILESKGNPLEDFKEALRSINNRLHELNKIFPDITCVYPEYRAKQVHCKGCPLYPVTCNIHKITYMNRGRKKIPLVWKFQTALNNGRRKDAKKILLHIIREIKRSMT